MERVKDGESEALESTSLLCDFGKGLLSKFQIPRHLK